MIAEGGYGQRKDPNQLAGYTDDADHAGPEVASWFEEEGPHEDTGDGFDRHPGMECDNGDHIALAFGCIFVMVLVDYHYSVALDCTTVMLLGY